MDRGGPQPLQGAAHALAQHGDAGDQEHDRRRQDRHHGNGDVVEDQVRAGIVAVDEVQQGQQRRRNDRDEAHRAPVGAQLSEDAASGGQVGAQVHQRCPPFCSGCFSESAMTARKAASTVSAPVLARRSLAVVVARMRPLRMRRTWSQRKASSMT